MPLREGAVEIQDRAVPESADSPGRRDLVIPLLVFAVTRALLEALGWAATRIVPDPHIYANRSLLPASDPLSHLGRWATPWFRFDAGWYAGVVAHGYRWGSPAEANTNFLPLFPLLSRAMQPLVGGSAWAATWLVANLAYAVAVVLLWRWARMRWDERVSFRVLLLTVFFPFAFFMAAPYSEPLFLALALAAFILAETGRWRWAIVAAGLAAVTRPVGVAVVLALAALWFARGERRRALLPLLGFLPLAAYVVYLGATFGHPLAFMVYHTNGWVPPHGSIMTTLRSQFHTTLSPFDRIDAALAAIFLICGVVVWRKLGAGYGVYVLIGAALPLTKGLAGMERYVSVLFPVMALWGTWRSRLGGALLFAVSLFSLILFTVLFTAGYSIF